VPVDQLEFVEAEGELSLPEEAIADAPRRTSARMPRFAMPASFAGIRISTLLLAAFVLGLLGWNAWITRELAVLKRHRPVSVSLATLVTDFVRDQSHQPTSPDEAAFRTKLYLVATQKVLADLGRDGTPVFASEAVLGSSVPDETAQVRSSVTRAMAASAGQH
jgi:hypothetical protein